MAQKLSASDRRALRAEAADWDRLSDEELTRLFENDPPLGTRVRRPLPKVVPIALDEANLNRLKRVARRKQVHVHQLVAMWIAERLAQEQVERRPRRMA
ncbi:MAG: hypothetical protein HYU42_04495 [Candidatus Rokubacteria bacterium]|nr:hypothetical protein [Candidatus Rokubacteria bacterium]MBI3105825.1 hypothetical protein [Candidatus Rokubacteria bacterium]